MKTVARISRSCPAPYREARRAFTLIEMLVASALVVLMMTIFAEVFQMASGSMTLQRTIAENDQQVRTFTTILRGDLQKRTFRNMVPFFPREDFNQAGLPFADRQGYFYLSLNDPNNGADTVLQFTVDSSIKTETSDETPYYGKASILGPANQFRFNPNQPESDDGQIEPNGTTSSSAAEVAYFVRNGVLYRRVVLLRQPLVSVGTGSSGASTVQPRTASNAPYFTSGTNLDYWNSFDVAAYRDRSSDAPTLLGMDGTGSALDNQRYGPTDDPLGRSRYRFGFDCSYQPGGPVWSTTSGLSREFFGANNDLFLGRFTHEETSSPGFRYPCAGTAAPSGNPFIVNSIPAHALADANSNGVVDLFEGGNRVGQDILLTHVHSFEVEFYDDRLRAFAPIGHTQLNGGIAGDYHLNRCLNLNYKPTGAGIAGGYVFDSWHPLYDQDGGGANDSLPLDHMAPMAQDLPPYRPMTFDPVGKSAPPPPPNGGGSPRWVHNPASPYQVNDIVFPPTEDVNYNGQLDMGESVDGDNLIDGPTYAGRRPVNPYGRVYYYICRRAAVGNAVPSGFADQPAWGTSPGRVFGHESNTNLPLWEAVLNVRPTRAMRITVRFLHRGSNKLRQLTLIHSLRDQ